MFSAEKDVWWAWLIAKARYYVVAVLLPYATWTGEGFVVYDWDSTVGGMHGRSTAEERNV
jgi:hypothetical protein